MHGLDKHEGILYVVHDNELGTVCSDAFDPHDAAMACRQLGYPGGKQVDNWIFDFERTLNDRIWLGELHCDGDEQTFADCRHSPWGLTACTHEDYVALECDTGR